MVENAVNGEAKPTRRENSSVQASVENVQMLVIMYKHDDPSVSFLMSTMIFGLPFHVQ